MILRMSGREKSRINHASEVETMTPTNMLDDSFSDNDSSSISSEPILIASPRPVRIVPCLENEAGEVSFARGQVYVHPSAFAKDNIEGTICIVNNAPSDNQEPGRAGRLLSWIPSLATFSDHSFSLPLSELYSIYLKRPTLSDWEGSISINSRGGISWTVYFHQDASPEAPVESSTASNGLYAAGGGVRPTWGGEAVLFHLRKYIEVIRSAHDHGLFLCTPSETDRQVHETVVFDDNAVSPSILHLSLGGRSRRNDNGDFSQLELGDSRTRKGKGREGDELRELIKDTRNSVLGGFARLTRSATGAARESFHFHDL